MKITRNKIVALMLSLAMLICATAVLSSCDENTSQTSGGTSQEISDATSRETSGDNVSQETANENISQETSNENTSQETSEAASQETSDSASQQDENVLRYELNEDGDGYSVVGYEHISDTLNIPSTYKGLPVTEIDCAFGGCPDLKSVTIPDSITAFWEFDYSTEFYEPDGNAFSGCTGLESIEVSSGNKVFHSNGNCIIATATKKLVTGCKSSVIPSDGSVTVIGREAFSGCTGLTSIDIPDSVTYIGREAFSGCTGLTSIDIPNNVTQICVCAFLNCTGLTSINISDSVTYIGAYAFSGCTGLTSITIPDNVTTISNGSFGGGASGAGNAFVGCTNLESMEVSSGNKVLHSEGNCIIETASKTLVAGCKNSVIPDDGSVTSIGDNAFLRCTDLTNITIPNSVTKIGFFAFSGCTGLTSVTIPDSVTEIYGSAFLGCTGLTSIDISDSVTEIDGYAFYGCTGLTSITIPYGVTEINDKTFSHCTGLRSITLPSSVTAIRNEAFYECTGLTDINYNGTKEQWNSIYNAGWDDETGDYTVHCTDGDIKK